MSDPKHCSEGFTLVEVLIALVILALAFGPAWEGISGGLGWVGRGEQEQRALVLAQSLLDSSGSAIAGQRWRQAGTDHGFRWSLDVTPREEAQPPQPGQWIGYDVRATAHWTDRRRERSLQLETVRIGPWAGSS